jgi:hypothetical protein
VWKVDHVMLGERLVSLTDPGLEISTVKTIAKQNRCILAF